MAESGTAVVEPRSERSKEFPAPNACIDLDRFCDGCGYNLRTLAVTRDPHLGIPVVRCPECGRFHAANHATTVLRPWLNRATSLLLAAWVLTITAVFIHVGLGEGALSYVTLDELTTYTGWTSQQATVGTRTVTWRGPSGPLEVRTGFQDYELFVTAVLACSLALGFACAVLAVVVFPHWRRAAYVGLALGLPVIAEALVAAAWSHEAPHLFIWGLQYITIHLAAQCVGGLLGIAFGRPLARLTVRILLPPSLWPRLAYLWLADDKPLPRP